MDNKDRQLLKQIYDLLRTSCLSTKYYGHKIDRLTKLNYTLEIILAVGTTGSGISGWWLWNQWGPGKIIWGVITGLSALLAILKPILNWGKKIEEASKQYEGYQINLTSLRRLAAMISVEQAITPEIKNRFDTIYERHEKLSSGDDRFPSRRLIGKLQEQVNTEIPVESLWWPT